MSMPPDLFPGRAPGKSDRANHLGKIQTALLGMITPALTLAAYNLIRLPKLLGASA
jgi:hypothetical protein